MCREQVQVFQAYLPKAPFKSVFETHLTPADKQDELRLVWFVCLQNFAAQMAGGFDEKAGGAQMGVMQGPMVCSIVYCGTSYRTSLCVIVQYEESLSATNTKQYWKCWT